MVERFNEKRLNVFMTDRNYSTGYDNVANQLLPILKDRFDRATSIDIIVSFIMRSGIKHIKTCIEQALKRNVPIRILTGLYLNITDPAALYELKLAFGDKLDIRLFADQNRSFHPKSYIFRYGKDRGEIFIGSSNISDSALTKGIEWNYGFLSESDPNGFQHFSDTFSSLFLNSIPADDNVLNNYSRHRKKCLIPNIPSFNISVQSPPVKDIEPTGSQLEALYNLKRLREEHGNKALIVAATGIGKTFLAAFDSLGFKRVLYIAHRKEILDQAMSSFKCVRLAKSDTYSSMGYLLDGIRDLNSDLLFASVQSMARLLGNKEILCTNEITPERFDYIIVDECHHAQADTYRKILNYFKPKFLLGLTATPDRSDNKSIYELFEYCIPYTLTLQDAINKGDLVPFHYYGVYDKTDYANKVGFINGKFKIQDLESVLIDNQDRDLLVLKHYQKMKSETCLGFCCSINHAAYMAKLFNNHGISSCFSCSSDNGIKDNFKTRDNAISLLTSGKLKVIFCVDLFNEGVDIPAIDTVMFLRPTESPIIFLQQLGRGLRKSPGKEYLNVIDYIGNHKKATVVRNLLPTENHSGHNGAPKYPEGCYVDFDIELIDLFHELDKRNITLEKQINDEYLRIKFLLGRRPSRMDMFTLMNDQLCVKMLSDTRLNIFRDYLGFLNKLNELSDSEQTLIGSNAHDFIKMTENTSMTKSYKLPVLRTLLDINNQALRKVVSYEILLDEWMKFYAHDQNFRDLSNPSKPVKSYQDFINITPKVHIKNIFKNPVNFLTKSDGKVPSESARFIKINDNQNGIYLDNCLDGFLENKALIQHFSDVLCYRTAYYYKTRYDRLLQS